MSFAADSPSRPPGPIWIGYAAAVAMTGLATLIAVVVERVAPAPNLSLIFVAPVMIAAMSFGQGPSLVAAGLSALAYNYFLIAPLYTLRVADPANLWALALLTGVGVGVSALAAASRRRTLEARQAADQATAVRGLARDLVAETSRPALAARCAEALSALFAAPGAVLLEGADGELSIQAAGGADLGGADLQAARWSLASGVPSRAGAYPFEASQFDLWPVKSARRQQAVIALRISGGDAGRPSAPERMVEIVGGYLAVALDREALAREAMETQVRSAGDQLKADLLAAVSHDLRTPLSTILVTLQSLSRFDAVHDADARGELLAVAEAETQRLSRMVENLLDMNRIEAGALAARPAPADLNDLVAAAVDRAGPVLAGRAVEREVSASPRVTVDAALFETALFNVLDNAAKYSPAASPIRIVVGRSEEEGWVEVFDQGPGFGGRAEALFAKFVRGQEGDGRPPGVGLGLSISRALMESFGGRIEAFEGLDGVGARVRLSAPLSPQPMGRP